MANQGSQNYLYYPTDECVSIASQARQHNLHYNVYVSPKVWSWACAWKYIAQQEHRIEMLLHSFKSGLYKKMCTSESFIKFDFYHWAQRRWKPKNKAVKARLSAHVFMNPGDERPWILIYDSELDRLQGIIRKEEDDGRHTKDGQTEGSVGGAGPDDGASLDSRHQDQRVQDEAE